MNEIERFRREAALRLACAEATQINTPRAVQNGVRNANLLMDELEKHPWESKYLKYTTEVE